MNIDSLKLNESPNLNFSHGTASRSANRSQQTFDAIFDKAQHTSDDPGAQAREVIRIMQASMLGLFSTEDDSDFFSSPDFIRPPNLPSTTKSQGIDTYRAAQQSSPHRPLPTKRSHIEQMIAQVAQKVDLPSELIRSVVSAESSYRTDAVSAAGAQGLMQLMPETASEMGVENSFDPRQNLLGGSRYLKRLLDKYNGDIDHALAAYNWGQGNVDRRGLENMPTETRDYIARVKLVVQEQLA
ncbi:MAG: lytic transglycosylase domain-containing protein [Desulfuromonas sp.]|nr:lytic transglycosylase domain-containing protein [Desulfuromonas sp.]